MSAWKREPWTVVSPARLAEIIERLSAERRPERVAGAVLDAALAATGARGGRLTGRAGAVLAEDGDRAVGVTVGVDLPASDGASGRLAVWGVTDETAAEAALRLVATVGARSLESVSLQRERDAERERARRLGAAASAVRGTREPREAVARVLAEARALVGAPAAALVAGGAPTPEVAAYDGLDPLTPADLAALIPSRVRQALRSGDPWSGPLPAGTLRDRGFRSAALVGVGAGAGLGVLAVLREADPPVEEADLAALTELADHAATCLTMSVLQQELRDLGTVDPLTRFFNARYFAGRLDQECQRALRAGVPLSVAIMSLDGLAEMRAEGRESAAEAAVEGLATHVADRLRAMDVGCRLGPDELAAILPEVEGLDALRVGERIRTTMAGVHGIPDGLTLSVGVASFPVQAGTPETVVDGARAALGWARAHGGDRTFLYHAETAELLRAEERARAADDDAVLQTVASLAAEVDARHPATAGHSERVARLASLIAAELGLGPEASEGVRVAGLLHDVGKIGVSDHVILAEGPLSPAEEEELRRHPEIGERMLSGSSLVAVAPWVLHHHERMDGSGYPAGLAGEEIPLEARILAVANAYDRLASGVPGRPGIPASEALAELERRAGPDLDPLAVAALRTLLGRGAEGVSGPAA